MDLRQAIQVMEELVLHTDYVPCLVGHQGIGKTQATRELARRLSQRTGKEYGHAMLNLASLDSPDITGLPVLDNTRGRAIFAPMAVLPYEENVQAGLFPECGILDLEELNRVDRYLRGAVLNLLNERQVNGFRLAPGWKIVVTLNPTAEGFHVNELDLAEHSRLVELVVYPSVNAWLEYIYPRAGELGRDVAEYIAAHGDMLFHLGRDEKNQLITRYDISLRKTPDPRGWEKVMHILERCQLPDVLLQEVFAGIVGAEAAASFMAWRRNKERRPLKAEEVLEGYAQVRERLQQQLAGRDYDLVWATMLDVLRVLPEYLKRKEWSRRYQPNLVAFLEDLPEDHQLAWLRRVLSSTDPRVRDTVADLGSITDKLWTRVQVLNAEAKDLEANRVAS